MSKLVDWRLFLPTIAVLAAVAWVASRLLGLSFLPVFGLAVVAVLVNGAVATLEDDLPGGFNNPDGTATPIYASRAVLVAKWGLGIVLLAFAAAFLYPGLGAGRRAELPFAAGIAMACALLSLRLFIRRAWLLIAAVVSGLGGIVISALLR
jgi:hypothetical protein